jgi:putative transposase
VGQAATPDWLDSDGLHGYLLGGPVASAPERRRAVRLYAKLIAMVHDDDASFWQSALRGQVYLGDEAFVERMQARAEPQRVAHKGIPKAQRLRPLTLQECVALCDGDRSRALHMAYREAGMTMTALAEQTGLSVSHVSRLIASAEAVG